MRQADGRQFVALLVPEQVRQGVPQRPERQNRELGLGFPHPLQKEAGSRRSQSDTGRWWRFPCTRASHDRRPEGGPIRPGGNDPTPSRSSEPSRATRSIRRKPRSWAAGIERSRPAPWTRSGAARRTRAGGRAGCPGPSGGRVPPPPSHSLARRRAGDVRSGVACLLMTASCSGEYTSLADDGLLAVGVGLADLPLDVLQAPGHPPPVPGGRVQPAEESHQLADVVAGVVPAGRPPRPERPGPPVGNHRRAAVTVERVERAILVPSRLNRLMRARRSRP